MAEIDQKVNMSLDDIIKMEKKKKHTNPKAKQGVGPARGNLRGGIRNNARGAQGMARGNARGRNNNNNNLNNKRGPWRRFPQNNVRGGFVKKRFNNGVVKPNNLRRSRSNMSLNNLNMNMNMNMNPRSNSRGRFPTRRGNKFGLTRSRSRTNLSFNKPSFTPKNKGFLKRTNSMPNLRDPTSVYNRLGYQNPSQVAYRNRVKRAKNVLNQRNTKAMRMQSALSLTPNMKNLSPLERKAQKYSASRRYGPASLHSDQIMQAQRRAQYEHKLMRMRAAQANLPPSMAFMNSLNSVYNTNRHPVMSLYQPSMDSSNQFGLTPKKATNRSASRSASMNRQQGRSRSRSRSRARPANIRNNIINLNDNDLEKRSFSEVMYSINFGVTKRTLDERFSDLN